MKSFSAVALLALPLGAFALTITSPVAGDVWNSTGDHTIKWTSTSSDPTEFGMYLVNDNIKPPQLLPLNAQTKTSTNEYTFPNVLPIGKGYTIRFNTLNAPGTNDTLTESGQFEIVSGGPNVVIASSVSTTATSTETGSSSPEATGTGSSGSESSASGTSTASALSTAKSSGTATYGSRGYAIALGMVVIAIASMFVV